MDENEKRITKRKFTHFIRCVKDETTKYFSVWTQDLLFLAIFLTQATAQCVAQVILGLSITNTPIYWCAYHKRMVNVSKPSTSKIDNCKDDIRMKICTLPVIIEHYTAVSMIAHMGNIWSQTAPPFLLRFQRAYLVEYASFPTNIQFVEREVKESGFVSLGRRG